MPRAVVATTYGSPDEALSVIDVDPGDPGPGEVLVEVRAAAVNPIDWKAYSGLMGDDPARLPMRLGGEAAGVVRKAGPDADAVEGPVEVGDEVILGSVDGAYADVVLARAADVVPKPANLSFVEASGLLLTGATAAHALVVLEVEAHDTVLVHGATGGVGLMAVQLARLRGAAVVGTAAESGHDLLRSLGAAPVTYGDGLLERVRTVAPDGVTAVVDCVGTDEAIDVSLQLVDPSRVVSTAAWGRSGDGIRLIGQPDDEEGRALRAAVRPELSRWAEQGRLRVVVAATYPLEQAAEAHRQSRDGHTTGKIVLTT